MAEQVAQRGAARVEAVEARLAGEGRGRDAAVQRGQQRALPREEADQRAALVLLVGRLQRERGVGVRAPGERGRDRDAVVRHVVDLRAAVAVHGHEAVHPLALGVERAGEIGGDLLARVVAQLQLHFALRLGLRALRHEVEHAADAALAVEHRRRAAQQLHALQHVRVGPAGVVGAVGALQAVEVLHGVAAAGLERIHAAVEIARHHAGRVVGGLAQGERALGFDLVARDDRDGLRRLDQRRVGLGGGAAAPGDEARHGAGGGFTRIARDGHGGQRLPRFGSGGFLRVGMCAGGERHGGDRERGIAPPRARRSGATILECHVQLLLCPASGVSRAGEWLRRGRARHGFSGAIEKNGNERARAVAHSERKAHPAGVVCLRRRGGSGRGRRRDVSSLGLLRLRSFEDGWRARGGRGRLAEAGDYKRPRQRPARNCVMRCSSSSRPVRKAAPCGFFASA
ncbi:hypothetical protein FQZ97_637230 [compost metagenome]